jgi:deazaflavin-dependent oxidoreductase (nitroreductase family)
MNSTAPLVPTVQTNMNRRYLEPDVATRRVFNPAISWLTRRGLSVRGSRVLEVAGRKTGRLRTTPVNLLMVGTTRYLVAPRGNTEWVRNVRAAGGCTLRLGSQRERVTVIELADHDKPDILRAYLKVWKREVGQFFEGVGADASDEQLLAIASGYPVFSLRTEP